MEPIETERLVLRPNNAYPQRRGIGRRVLALVVEECRAQGARTLVISWADGEGSPRPLYERYGFIPTGEIQHGEVVARLSFE